MPMSTDTIELSGAFINTSSITLTVGTYDAANVAGKRTVISDASGGIVTIRGFAGGVNGQEIIVYENDDLNNLVLAHLNVNGTQKIVTCTGADRTIVHFGAFLLRYNGSYWYEIAAPSGA